MYHDFMPSTVKNAIICYEQNFWSVVALTQVFKNRYVGKLRQMVKQ
jgi:hypothetical protein